MIIALTGSSASGKSTIEKMLRDMYNFKKIISVTTRKPRDEEINGIDYFFVNNQQFDLMLRNGKFAEWEEYSYGRKYATYKSSYLEDEIDKVVVLTPNGIRQLKKSTNSKNIKTVLVKANLGNRIKRYIDRIGTEKFSFNDKDEICNRVERDFGMFAGMDKEVDLVIDTDNASVIDNVRTIISYFHI